MIINVSITELKEVFQKTPPTQNIMLSGKHGIGKSQIVTRHFQNLGIPVHTLFLGQMSDPGDIIGLPRINGEHTEFALPFWFPQDGKPIVLFLDELNRARPEVLQTIMDLALNRKIAGRELPKGSRIISAINAGEEYQLTELDPALVDRFNVYNLSPTPKEWLMHAEESGFDQRVISFINDNNGMLFGIRSEAASDLDKSPTPRAWEKVSDVIKPLGELQPIDKKIIAGIVGPEAATAFMAFQKNVKKTSGEDVLYHYKDVRDQVQKLRLHEMSLLNESLFRALSLANNVDTYMEDNLYHFVNDLFTDESRKEARSDFVAYLRKKDLYKAGIARMLKVKKVYSIVQTFYSSMNV